MKLTKWFPFFKAGDYSHKGKGNWPIDFCREAVANFTAGLYECPAVLAHPTVTDVDLGKAVKMRMDGDFIETRIAPEPELVSLVKRGKLKAVSARVRKDLNGKGPGFEHIAFLDKLPPGIPELAGIDFAEYGKDYADIVLKLNAADFAEGGKSAPFTPEEEAEIKEIIDTMIAEYSKEIDDFHEGKLKELDDRIAAFADDYTGAGEEDGEGDVEEVEDFGGPVSIDEVKKVAARLKGGPVSISELSSDPYLTGGAYRIAQEERAAKRAAANFSEGEDTMRTRKRSFITGADFSEPEAADFYDRNEKGFKEVGLEKADFMRHREAFSGDVETGRFLVLAERADFNEKLAAGQWESLPSSMKKEVSKEDFMKNAGRLNLSADAGGKPKVEKRQPTKEQAERYYDARAADFKAVGTSKADFAKNTPLFDAEDFALIGVEIEAGGAGESADMADMAGSDNSITRDPGAYYDQNRESFEKNKISRADFIGQVRVAFHGGKKKPGESADFSEEDAEAYYERHRKHFESQRVSKEAFMKNAPFIMKG